MLYTFVNVGGRFDSSVLTACHDRTDKSGRTTAKLELTEESAASPNAEAELNGDHPADTRTAIAFNRSNIRYRPQEFKVGLGRERRPGCELTLRHMHREAGVAVLSRGYEEAGDRGRFHVRAGDVVVHRRLDMHLDRFTASGAEILNLPATRWEDTEGTLGTNLRVKQDRPLTVAR
jgi:hypothetical protein